ncbi:type II toxin-antitoxin system RelE/ParE family toxin [Coleofasciculus sp. FACHB-T130]|uniref:type II toxin-antitoxin system RelE/ParE family toxin n=1 Tax=Cyanophyceae TaxID=3028117 RepID=UPI0016845129|nr:type II toxin-antitoxin system RelE/ParE family toxin [Coleofasciculus sp. FACHB-T130]MBD1880109.1 type II toxin-antitoxin system RelE/ParE family toxin [Coleofasciculus sp. FACHB-T130]
MAWTWELYQDGSGEIPKDLLAFFVGLMPPDELPSDPPVPVLTLSETKRLQVNLVRLCNKGLLSLTSDIFEKLEDDLYEFRMTKSEHNPRFVLTPATPQRFVVLHAFMKKYDGGIRDRDKEPARIRLRELKSREGR